MFKNLKDIGHECKMDNLFNSVNLAQAAYSLPQKVKIHGVIWKKGCSVLPIVFQDDLKGKHTKAAQGTVKAVFSKVTVSCKTLSLHHATTRSHFI